MRYLLLLQVLLIYFPGRAQISDGIKFEEKELTWEGVKQKAKSEKKYKSKSILKQPR